MILAVLRGNKIAKLSISDVVEGNYIVKDYKTNVIGVLYADNGRWIFNPNKGFIIEGLATGQGCYVDENQEIVITKAKNQEKVYLYLYKTTTVGLQQYNIKSFNLTIGRNGTISYASNSVQANHAKLTKNNNIWLLEAIDNNPVYVNDRLVRRKIIEHGDIIFIYGLKISIIGNSIIIQSINKNASVTVNNDAFDAYQPIVQEIKQESFSLEGDVESYDTDDEFSRSPRFTSNIKHEDVKITAPPSVKEQQTQPEILSIGPRLTMMLSSMSTVMITLGNVATGQATLQASLLPIILSLVMMLSSIMWPLLSRKYQKRRQRKEKIKNTRLYRKYLEKKEKDIQNILALQQQILLENNLSFEDLQLIIYNQKRNLWERAISDDDFLTVRVGKGKVKCDIKVSWEEEDFSLEDSYLIDELKEMLARNEYIDDMPMNLSLVQNKVTGIIGNYALLYSFTQGLMLQLVTMHLYSELKIVILSDENKVADWNYMKFAPHCWDNQHEMRLIASTMEEKKQLSSYLESIYAERGEDKDNQEMYKDFNTYYLIVVDNIDECRNLGIIKTVLESECNNGFSILIKNDRIANLPRQCSTFINVTDTVSGIFSTELDEDNQKQFVADFNKTVNVERCIQRLSNIFVEVPKEKHELPKSVGFMEMYQVGNVDQYNSMIRWKMNNPVNSLAVPIGIDQSGNTFYMDIHEKAYGPHGLVAGTTGSGKSEWLLTYILSLAINFSPLEVQFVLIDYKGGGLAGSFENTETGMALPHLVGTITNLDKSEIRRSIASLEAESKRRQKIFNDARDKLDDSSMDIYKYQQYFRKGMVDEPLSHLIIISDEFAELKSQEPEFLDSLVSIARVGRSLGIHLILATQKPGGIVTDQIWSNSRFKICLRVQDKGDSQDMIKCPDAAYLKQTGAFYLQVGLNEVFALGQSAYSGLKYTPTNMVKKNIPTAIEELSRLGSVTNSVEVKEENKVNSNVHGEELLNSIKYLDDLAQKLHIRAKRLWLNPIPEFITTDALKRKYKFNREEYNVCPVIGEYDDPEGQQQCALTVNLSESSVAVFGTAGSGKEMFLQNIIYSCITSYTPNEINFFVMDFGAETLGVFEKAPHVGDIVFSSDKVKITNLYRMIKNEYVKRRQKYREYGGNYDSYNKYGPKKEPLLCVMINAFQNFRDLYPEISENLEKILIDSHKYGIIFIIAAADNRCIRVRSLNSIQHVFMLHVNDPYDYISQFGSGARGIVPKDLKGRGLFGIDKKFYEFQTASICKEEDFQVKVKKVCERLDDYYLKKSHSIPMIPNPITLDYVDEGKASINNLFVGYAKSSIDKIWINIQANYSTLITSNKKTNLVDFNSLFYQELDSVSTGLNVVMLDVNDSHKGTNFDNIKIYGSEEYKEQFINIVSEIKAEYDKYKATTDKKSFKPSKKYILILDGFSDMIPKLELNEKEDFKNIVDYADEIKMVTFILSDVANSIKGVASDKAVTRLMAPGNGIFLDTSADGQLFMDCSLRDIKTKEQLADNEGYVFTKNNGVFAQLLKTEKVGSDDDEV